jgi:hypothetical protein
MNHAALNVKRKVERESVQENRERFAYTEKKKLQEWQVTVCKGIFRHIDLEKIGTWRKLFDCIKHKLDNNRVISPSEQLSVIRQALAQLKIPWNKFEDFEMLYVKHAERLT